MDSCNQKMKKKDVIQVVVLVVATLCLVIAFATLWALKEGKEVNIFVWLKSHFDS